MPNCTLRVAEEDRSSKSASETFVLGNQRGIVERLLKLAQPVQHVVIIQIGALPANDALGICILHKYHGLLFQSLAWVGQK